jgi:hypothetical protein
MRFFDPFNLMRPAMEASSIMAESQLVIGLRVAGMAGFWPMGKAETNRMVSEKMAAGVDSAQAMLRSGMAGGSLSDMAMAAMKPVRQKTKSNARRLTRKAAAL